MVLVICEGCGREASAEVSDGRDAMAELSSLSIRCGEQGWERTALSPCWRERDYCPTCLEAVRGAVNKLPAAAERRGFTLIELLVVLVIVSVVVAAAAPVVLDALDWRGVRSGAQILQGALVEATTRAARDGSAGVRLVLDPAFPVSRLADGRIDPASALAYSRILPLESPPAYAAGVVSIHPEGFPPGFTPRYRRLILEEEIYRDGLRAEPTSWAWNVRVGDQVHVGGRNYTVTGPTAVAIGRDNPEGFVNFGKPGAAPPLSRYIDPKTGKPIPSEWLELADQVDDDGDGWIDPGWDGMDQNLNGLVDEDAEWEVERWGDAEAGGLTAAPYTIQRRPIVANLNRETTLPAPVVVDATGWTTTALGARLRSQAPVDAYTGSIDLLFESIGRVSVPNHYNRPTETPLGREWVHFWIADRADVTAPAEPPRRPAAMVSVDLRNAHVIAGDVDGADPEAAFNAVERTVR